MKLELNVVVMCGGSGSRLWPLSRDSLPKQFLKLTDKHRTMFQLTCLNAIALRACKLTIVCNEIHRFLIEEQINELNIKNFQIVCEPFGKDTAAAIATASILIPIDEHILVLTADHVWNTEALIRTVQQGLDMCDNNVVFFGIKPTYAETGYGYIQHDREEVIQFVEKPDLNTAKMYLIEGNFAWNSGVFLFRNDVIQEAYKKHANDILEGVRETLLNSGNLMATRVKLNKDYFDKVACKSVDYAIMEHILNGKLIRYDGYWCDVGSFEALYNHLEKDDNKNVILGEQEDVHLIDSHNCIVSTENRLIAVIGCEDLIVADTRDALLVCGKNASQKVKKMVNKLKEDNRDEHKFHCKVFRPWGWYVNVEGHDLNGFKVKLIGVYPGKRLSLQSHHERSEHWVIVKGNAKVQVGKDFLHLGPNQHVYIPKETLHRMENVGDELVEFVETQIGDYLGEDDIVRYEDDFGRIE